MRNATVVAAWDLHRGRLRSTLTLHMAAMACNSPLGTCLSQRDWIAIAADDFTTLDAIATYGFLILYLRVCFIHVFFNYYFVKGVCCSSAYPIFLCSDHSPVLLGSDTKGSTVVFSNVIIGIFHFSSTF